MRLGARALHGAAAERMIRATEIPSNISLLPASRAGSSTAAGPSAGSPRRATGSSRRSRGQGDLAVQTDRSRIVSGRSIEITVSEEPIGPEARTPGKHAAPFRQGDLTGSAALSVGGQEFRSRPRYREVATKVPVRVAGAFGVHEPEREETLPVSRREYDRLRAALANSPAPRFPIAVPIKGAEPASQAFAFQVRSDHSPRRVGFRTASGSGGSRIGNRVPDLRIEGTGRALPAGDSTFSTFPCTLPTTGYPGGGKSSGRAGNRLSRPRAAIREHGGEQYATVVDSGSGAPGGSWPWRVGVDAPVSPPPPATHSAPSRNADPPLR